jgi:hypothetical protein
VEQLEPDKFDFEIATLKIEVRPAFNPKVYLKLDIFHPHVHCIVTAGGYTGKEC